MRKVLEAVAFFWLGVVVELFFVGRIGAAEPVEFVDVAQEVGIGFKHVNGASGHKYFPETMGGGAAFFDYDGDQDLDIYLVNGAALPGYQAVRPPVNVLYKNEGGVFAEVGAAAGVDDAGYGMGCAAADYDNDADLDLYLTNYGANVLYRNEGSGIFTDVTASAAVGDTSWSTSCAFLDYDNDGDLDLYVANYVHYELEYAARDLEPYLAGMQKAGAEAPRTYQHPRNFPGAEDRLWCNKGNGLFEDVTAASGLADTVWNEGRGLGVVATDYDNDGDVDLYVANDAVRNFLYRNNADGTFAEIGALVGVAYGVDGQREAGMGVDAGDYDNDGYMDLVVTNFEQEPASLYRNNGRGFFPHVSYLAGVGLPSLKDLSFGTGFVDYDNDGYQDLFIASGHVLDNIALFDQSTSYEQQNMLLRNQGPDQQGRYRFEDVSDRSGAGLLLKRASRGTAFGDYDDDGDVDILVGNIGRRPNLLRNDGGNGHNWLQIKTIGRQSNRDGIGARVSVRAGELFQVREVRAHYSYLSHSDLRLNFGLGDNQRVEVVEIRWPGGAVERINDVGSNQVLVIAEGEKR